MIKVMYLDRRVNSDLRKELAFEYLKEDFVLLVNPVLEIAQASTDLDFNLIPPTVFNILNSIILDNLYQYTIYGEHDAFVNKVISDNLLRNIHVRHAYLSILTNSSNDIDTEKTIRNTLSNYVEHIYKKSINEYNKMGIELYTYMKDNLVVNELGTYRFDFYKDIPMLIYSRRA